MAMPAASSCNYPVAGAQGHLYSVVLLVPVSGLTALIAQGRMAEQAPVGGQQGDGR